ncbi:urea transport system permease protein [Pseudorhodobacter antarcticus]|uniref:Urea transport system permease protein n=1 Tax=Pseudorhodobacter antarcticus TaxID=1077947 RepID=A0A1H8N1R7_9RHOB|nr:urea transport system permease protein [Pseudorhodobacter antarcticus]
MAFRSRVAGGYLSILTQAMTLALALYLFQNDSGLRGNNGLSGLQNLPGLGHVGQDVMLIWFFWASAAALALADILASWIVSGKFGSVIRAIRDDEARVSVQDMSRCTGLSRNTITKHLNAGAIDRLAFGGEL